MPDQPSRYDILFEPVEIGPVTAPNRFYQVPHCNGLGHVHPHAEAANRKVKAEGGWGVVCTQEAEIHPSSEIWPAMEARIWDDRDLPALRLMTDAVHEHGALAGIELVYNGHHAPNRYSRVPPMAPSSIPVDCHDPVQAREMTRRDIRNLRQWYVDAARRARQVGFDIIYVYAGHDMTLLQHFLTPRYNQRQDEYGGSLVNRVRLVHETLSDVKEAVGDTCGIAFRFAVDELLGEHGIRCEDEGREIVRLLAEVPDLWDVNVSDWSNDSATARFEPQEGYQQPFTAFVKSETSKPVVAVGRFTAPDAMVTRIRQGVLDLIGCARASIADPWLPNKVRDGHVEDIRECIGCNICVASDNLMSPIRCTQNPTAGEEWRRGWHPEHTDQLPGTTSALVVGAGPAGLECAMQLAKRGADVVLAERSAEFGGRSLLESKLPGLASWIRVRDYRLHQLQKMPNVQLLPGNHLALEDIDESAFDHVYVATGARWRSCGRGRQHPTGISMSPGHLPVLTPDDILAGVETAASVIVYDDDHYYMGGVIAEALRQHGSQVALVTPAAHVSSWTINTLELERVQRHLHALGISIWLNHEVSLIEQGGVVVEQVYSQRQRTLAADAICLVTSREPQDDLYRSLIEHQQRVDTGATVQAIGDCYAPSTIAAAVFGGHQAARLPGIPLDQDSAIFTRQLPAL